MENKLRLTIVSRIKQKKELKGIANKIIEDELNNYLTKHKLNLINPAKKEIKIIIKDIRSKLRTAVGMFQTSNKNRALLLENNKISELLKTHYSTAERFDFYPYLKKIIKKLNINSIIDLGCGLNPLALAEKNVDYCALDINEEDLSLVKKYFEKNSINGRVIICDLRKLPENIPKADLAIIFKVLDIIEKSNYKLAEKIIQNAGAKYILVSFATRTISGKPMVFKRRKWLEYIIKRLNYPYNTFNSNNEIFYLINKSS